MPRLTEQQTQNFVANLENHLQDHWLKKQELISDNHSSLTGLKTKLREIKSGKQQPLMSFVEDVAQSLGREPSSLLRKPPVREPIQEVSEKIIKKARQLNYTRESLAKTLDIPQRRLFSTINQGTVRLSAQDINKLSLFLSLEPETFKPFASENVDFTKLHGGSTVKLNKAILKEVKALSHSTTRTDTVRWLSQNTNLGPDVLHEVLEMSTSKYSSHKTYKNYQKIIKPLNTSMEEIVQLSQLHGTSLRPLPALREISFETFHKANTELKTVKGYGGFYKALEGLRNRHGISPEQWGKTFNVIEQSTIANKAMPSAEMVNKVCCLFNFDIKALNREIGIVHGKAMGDLIKKGAKKIAVVAATGVGASLAFANPALAALVIEEAFDPNEGVLPSSPTAISATTLAMLSPYRWYAAGGACALSLTNYCGEVLRDGSKKYAELLKGLSTDTDFVGFDGLSEQERVEAGRIFGTGLVKVTEWLSDNLKLLTAKADKKVSEGMQVLVKQAQDNANNPKEALHFSYRTLDQECKEKGGILWAKVKKGLHEVGKMVQEQGESYAKQVEDLPTPLIHINGISEQELAQAIIGFGKLLQKNHQHEPAVNSLEKTAAGMPETELPNAQASPINKEESSSAASNYTQL